EKSLLSGVIIRKVSQQSLPVIKTVVASQTRTLCSCQNKVLHQVDCRKWSTSIIQRLKQCIGFRMTAYFNFDKNSLGNFTLYFKQSRYCVARFLNILIQSMQKILITLSDFSISPILFLFGILEQTVFKHNN